MKVGIITFHNGSNYGAALQSFALQEAEKKICNDVYIINYDNHFISKGLDRIRFGFSLLGIYSFFSDIFNFNCNGRKIANFHKFFENYYNLTPLMSFNELKEYNDFFDIGLSGSDQIWNPLLNNKVDDIYFLNFGNFSRKISYASCFGNYKFNNNIINERISELLKSYQKISTREKSIELETIILKKVYNVVDPTLLLSKDEWVNKLSLKKSNKERYLLTYIMSNEKDVMIIAKYKASERNLKIINIGKLAGFYWGVRCICDAGPREFVELIYNADYIVTNSFHGTAFSVNFNKQFLSVVHPKSPERAAHLLKMIDLESRLVNIQDFSTVKDIDEDKFKQVSSTLDDIRKDSLAYLD